VIMADRALHLWASLLGVIAFVGLLGTSLPLQADEASQSVTSHGLTVYFGVMPAAIAEGITGSSMHGAQPPTAHSHHLIVAIFNSVTGNASRMPA